MTDYEQQIQFEVLKMTSMYRQFGEIRDITAIQDVPHKEMLGSLYPEKSWVVRFQVHSPSNRLDVFLVSVENEKVLIKTSLGYDPIEGTFLNGGEEKTRT